MTMTDDPVHIDIFPTSPIGPVSPFIFSGFLEHLGKCIYGGILPSTPTSFPYTSHNPCPPSEFIETPMERLTWQEFRKDVVGVLRDELKVPMVRWPGGNFVSSYRWEDGVGPKQERRRRMELAWGGEESNLFGTDECVFAIRLIGYKQALLSVHADSSSGVEKLRLSRTSCSTWATVHSAKL